MDDPWASWRFQRCNRCQVVALPWVIRWLDPSWLLFVARTSLPDCWDALAAWWRSGTPQYGANALPSPGRFVRLWRAVAAGVRRRWFKIRLWIECLLRWYGLARATPYPEAKGLPKHERHGPYREVDRRVVATLFSVDIAPPGHAGEKVPKPPKAVERAELVGLDPTLA